MTGQRVLICDDEPQILHALTLVLSDAGFRVVPCSTADEALGRAAVRPPEAAIIDLLLPDGHGVEVCQRLREWSDMPIIVLSAVDEEEEKVRALMIGADDFVTKPFSPAELVARLEAALRRVTGTPDRPIVGADGLEIDLTARTVRVNGREVRLTPIEYDVLRTLVRNHGKLMTHQALLLEVWGPGYEGDTPSLRFHISNLRAKLASHDRFDEYVRTEQGIGYRFAPPTCNAGDRVARFVNR
ncbi:MAG TPA: response regulator transcription factor [Solirubrobacteraceae bacterium]|nr:response regulator transcription factor [Solirubrobacteraceae bacterium]